MNSYLSRFWWKDRLKENLPGVSAQLRMSPTFRGNFPDQGEALRAAVLVLLYPVDEVLQLVFMKRNEYNGPHSGQVSFPGGAWEAQDLNLEQTALRETREEMGIQEKMEILGALTPLHIPVSNFLVQPFVAWLDQKPVFQPDRTEVKYVIEATLRDLLDPANRDSETRFHHGQSFEAPFYLVGKNKIWGATAMMLSEFLELASRKQ